MRSGALPLLLLLSLVVSLMPHGLADPTTGSEGGAIRRATWDFSTPADYAGTDVSLAPGAATLATETRVTTYATDADFIAAELAANRTVVRGGVRLAGDASNRLSDGTFDRVPSPWTFQNGTTGEVVSRLVAAQARLSHATQTTQLDTMDDVRSWYPLIDCDPTIVECSSTLSQETQVVEEGTGSLRDDLGLPAGAGRDDPGVWDWSAYTRLAVWIHADDARVRVSVRLQDGAGANRSLEQALAVGWNRYVWDLSAFPIDLGAVDAIEFHFRGTNPFVRVATIYLDDLALLRVLPFDESASVSQTFAKPATGGIASGIVVTYSVEASPAVGVAAALVVSVNGTVESSESPVPTGTRSLYLDLSRDASLLASGTFLLAFSLHLTRIGPTEASMSVGIDNVALRAPDYAPGTFTAIPVDAGSGAVWNRADVTADTPLQTSVAVETRTGGSADPGNRSWSGWATTNGSAIVSAPARYLQWRLLLATTNGSRTPVVTTFAITIAKYAAMGTILTAPFLPSEPLYRWREFLADHATPAGTSVGYDVSFGGGPWMPVAHGQDLAAYPLESVRVRSTLATGDTLATPSIASFTIRYEVLGPLTAVLVSPTNVTIAWGDAVNFTANAHDPWGHALPLACLWTTSDPMGTVAGDGTATATYVSGGVGIWSVRCESADHAANGTATVTVEANRLGRIDVTPSNATIRTDETLPFTANAYDTRGHPVLASPTWSATGGAIDEDGVYTPGPPGSFGILATTDGIVGRANVTVVLGQLARIDVTPASTTITADESLQFTANGFDMRDNDVVIAPMWSATCGSVNMTGWYAPRDVGSCTVYANATGISGSGRVAVLAGALARLAIAPTNATITADDVLTFTATGYDGNGNAVPVTPTWDAEQGAIDGAGLYEPTFAGVWSVSARAGGLNASTRVTVLPGALARLAVSPGDVDLSADETLQFTATGYDRAGNPVPIAPFWEAQDGTISGGAYVPHHTGVWSVNASQALIVGTALVHVRPGAIARIMVSPTASNMKEGDQVAFTAIAYDVKGNEVPGGNVAWRVDGDVGTIDAEGLFRATRAGHGLVVASTSVGASLVEGSADVFVEGSPLSNPWILVAVAATPFVLMAGFVWRRHRRIAALRARLAQRQAPTAGVGPADPDGGEDDDILG